MLPLWDFAFAYVSGIFSAISPCSLAILPLVLIRFLPHATNDDGKKKQDDDVDTTRHTRSDSNGTINRVHVLPLLTGSGVGSQQCARISHWLGSLIWWKSGSGLFGFFFGFEFCYFFISYFLSKLLTSAIQNSLRLTFGSLFLTVSALALNEQFDPMQLPILQHTPTMGATFALLMSVNPCSVPFLALLVTLGDSSDSTASDAHSSHNLDAPSAMHSLNSLFLLLSFAQGLLTPAVAFLLVGRSMFASMHRFFTFFNNVKKASNVLLLLSALYLLWKVEYLYYESEALLVALAVLINSALVLKTITATEIEREKDEVLPSTNSTADHSERVSISRVLAFCFIVFLLFFALSNLPSHRAQTHEMLQTAMNDGTQRMSSQRDNNIQTAQKSERLHAAAEVSTEETLHTLSALVDDGAKSDLENENGDSLAALEAEASLEGFDAHGQPLAAGAVSDSAQADKSSSKLSAVQCLDLSAIPPCAACKWCLSVFFAFTLFFFALPFVQRAIQSSPASQQFSIIIRAFFAEEYSSTHGRVSG